MKSLAKDIAHAIASHGCAFYDTSKTETGGKS
jgi:hypothetical protein